MSYRISLSFKNCEKSQVHERVEDFIALVVKNAEEIVKDNFTYFPTWRLEQLWEKRKDKWELYDYIEDWVNKVFTYHIYYARDIESLCITWGTEVPEIQEWFDGYVYFQDSTDQDYEYNTWKFNDKFKEYTNAVEAVKTRAEFAEVRRKLTTRETRYDEEYYSDKDREGDDYLEYDKKSFLYDLCYHEIQDIWDKDMTITVGRGLTFNLYECRMEVIRMLCGITEHKHADKEQFEFWRSIFE